VAPDEDGGQHLVDYLALAYNPLADLGNEAVADALELFEPAVKIRVGHVGRHEGRNWFPFGRLCAARRGRLP
jgi:hypothetical protein